ncbi:MAG: hypothetical protein OIF40_06895 [Mangrovicoccus sp.]|nr:hypothetical protein [Mangrovicoccus sp.]
MIAQFLSTMFRRAILTCLCMLCPAITLADAWPRGAGQFFSALSLESTYDRSALTWDDPSEEPPLARNFTKLYAEYGLSPRYTLGVELEQDYLFTQQQGVVFVQAALAPSNWRNQFAVELGVGQREGRFGPRGEKDTEPLLRPALYYGRGFETGWGQSWAGAAFSAEHRVDSAETAYKLDLTLGISHGDDTLHYAQIQSSKYPETDTAARLLLSRVSRMNQALWLETGLIAGLVTDESIGLRIALWAEF